MIFRYRRYTVVPGKSDAEELLLRSTVPLELTELADILRKRRLCLARAWHRGYDGAWHVPGTEATTALRLPTL